MIWTAASARDPAGARGPLRRTALPQSSDGATQLLTDGLVIDLVAVAVIVASAWSLLRERRRA